MKQFALVTILLSTVLAVLFWPALRPDNVAFSNDGPLGSVVAADAQLPASSVAIWNDLNHIGSENPPHPLSPSSGFRVLCYQTDLLWRAIAVLFTYWFCCGVTGDGWRKATRQATAAVCLVCAGCCVMLGVGVAVGWIDRIGESAWYNAPLVTAFLLPFLLIITLTLESNQTNEIT